MKNKLFFPFLALSMIFLFSACEQESLPEPEQLVSENAVLQFRNNGDDSETSRALNCPRQDVDFEGINDIHHLADELTDVINCGKRFLIPYCGSDDPIIEDETTVLVEEWCYTPVSSCVCNDFPDGVLIADQDLLIAEAISLLNAAFPTCSINNDDAVQFHATINLVPTCESISIRLFATAQASCCPRG